MNKKALSLDAVLLFLLVLVRIRIDTEAIGLIPRPTELIAKVPFFGPLFSPDALKLLNDWMADPISLLLITATFGLTTIYLLLDVWANWPRRTEKEPPEGSANERNFYRAKLVLLYLIILIITGVGTLLVVELRHLTDPAQYAHDGGVLETESALDYLMAGKNPYVETYRGTPAEKLGSLVHGLSHYPYLPWSFLASVPFYVASKATLGWYDQRFVYLLALAVTLALVPKLARRPSDKLALVMLVGLNPIMGNDIVYGMNDILVVLWLIVAAYLLRINRPGLSAGALGLAMVTKGTAWPILPFYLLYLFRQELGQFAAIFRETRAGLKPAPTGGIWLSLKAARKALPALQLSSLGKLVPFFVTSLAVMLPFALWNFGAMVEDAWSYNMGSPVVDPLPIKGWGLANLVLTLGWVKQVWDYFPFWIFEGLFALPVFAVLLFRQWRHNTLDSLLLNFGLFSLVFFFLSRTMNANYVGFALVFVAVGYFGDELEPQSSGDEQGS